MASREVQDWLQLAAATKTARFHAIAVALSTSSIARRALVRADLLVHAVIGLDPSGELSRELIRSVILPVLQRRNNIDIYAAAGVLASHLRLKEPDLSTIAAVLVERMQGESDGRAVSQIGQALAMLSGKLASKDVQAGAAVLVERMKTETRSYRLSELNDVLAGLSPMLEPGELKRGAAILTDRIRTEPDIDDRFKLAMDLGCIPPN